MSTTTYQSAYIVIKNDEITEQVNTPLFFGSTLSSIDDIKDVNFLKQINAKNPNFTILSNLPKTSIVDASISNYNYKTYQLHYTKNIITCKAEFENELRITFTKSKCKIYDLMSCLDGLHDYNLITGKVFISDQFWETLGVDKCDNWQQYVSHEDLVKYNDFLQQYIKSCTNFNYVLACNGKHGEVWFKISGSIMSVNNIAYRIICSYDDITSYIKQSPSYQESDRNKYLIHLSHELKNYLNNIYVLSQLTLDSLPDTNKNIQHIIKSAEGMKQLLNSISDIAKSEINELSIHSSHINPNIVNQHVISRLRAMIVNKRINICVRSPSDKILNLLINVDKNRYIQIIQNILLNSIKYSRDNGNIIISELITNNNYVFVVTDNGIGIPINELGNIGNPFFRASNTSNKEGNGIGITICKRLAHEMKGELSITSNGINKGTRVTLDFPIVNTVDLKMYSPVSSPADVGFSLPMINRYLIVGKYDVFDNLIKSVIPNAIIHSVTSPKEYSNILLRMRFKLIFIFANHYARTQQLITILNSHHYSNQHVILIVNTKSITKYNSYHNIITDPYDDLNKTKEIILKLNNEI